MSPYNFSVLICTNGHEPTKPALEYGVWLAELLNKHVFLLGVDEDVKFRGRLENLLEEAAKNLSQKNISYETQIRPGHGTDLIAQVANSGDFLTVVGPLGRPTWQRVVQGRSFRRLLAKVESPILYVPQACLPLRRMLICLGGLEYAQSVEHLSLLIARAAGAQVTLLHVVEPISLNYPTTKEIYQHMDNILETDTPQGRNIGQALADIRAVGLTATLKVRQGSIVHEIREEVQLGDYDMIGLGSPYSTKSLRHLYTPNVTAEVAEVVNHPVLAVRNKQTVVG